MSATLRTNNERLRDLVDEAGVSEAVSLTIFNRGLGTAARSMEDWKSFLAEPGTQRFCVLDNGLLAHAEEVFAKVIRKP